MAEKSSRGKWRPPNRARFWDVLKHNKRPLDRRTWVFVLLFSTIVLIAGGPLAAAIFFLVCAPCVILARTAHAWNRLNNKESEEDWNDTIDDKMGKNNDKVLLVGAFFNVLFLVIAILMGPLGGPVIISVLIAVVAAIFTVNLLKFLIDGDTNNFLGAVSITVVFMAVAVVSILFGAPVFAFVLGFLVVSTLFSLIIRTPFYAKDQDERGYIRNLETIRGKIEKPELFNEEKEIRELRDEIMQSKYNIICKVEGLEDPKDNPKYSTYEDLNKDYLAAVDKISNPEAKEGEMAKEIVEIVKKQKKYIDKLGDYKRDLQAGKFEDAFIKRRANLESLQSLYRKRINYLRRKQKHTNPYQEKALKYYRNEIAKVKGRLKNIGQAIEKLEKFGYSEEEKMPLIESEVGALEEEKKLDDFEDWIYDEEHPEYKAQYERYLDFNKAYVDALYKTKEKNFDDRKTYLRSRRKIYDKRIESLDEKLHSVESVKAKSPDEKRDIKYYRKARKEAIALRQSVNEEIKTLLGIEKSEESEIWVDKAITDQKNEVKNVEGKLQAYKKEEKKDDLHIEVIKQVADSHELGSEQDESVKVDMLPKENNAASALNVDRHVDNDKKEEVDDDNEDEETLEDAKRPTKR